MADLRCDHCGRVRSLEWRGGAISSVPGLGHPTPQEPDDKIMGVLTCKYCHQQTIFGMTNNVISFYPTKEAYGLLTSKAPPKVSALFRDAELCFYGMGFRGAVGMCRACVEEALEKRGVKSAKLEDMINAAKTIDLLTDVEYMLAHGSRLAGNAALHKEDTLEPSNIPALLSATVSIINHLFP